MANNTKRKKPFNTITALPHIPNMKPQNCTQPPQMVSTQEASLYN